MRTNNRINVAIIIIMTALSGVMITSCSNEEATPTVESQSVEHVAYVATLSQEQQVLLASRMLGHPSLLLVSLHVGECLTTPVSQRQQELWGYGALILRNIGPCSG